MSYDILSSIEDLDSDASEIEVRICGRSLGCFGTRARPGILNRIWADDNEGIIGLATERRLQRPNITIDREMIGKFRTLRRVDRHHRLARMIELAVQPEFLDM